MIAWHALAAGLLLVPIVDQGVKYLVRQRLATEAVRLGPLGCLRAVQTRMWLARPWGCPNSLVVWGVWTFAAVLLVMFAAHFSAFACFVGLLLGGSLSHALETTIRGGVTDYICLRFWPAFNLADVAITVGAMGMGVTLLAMILGGQI